MTAPRLALTLTQRLRIGTEVQKALHLLQLPGIELAAAVRGEILENPCLEIDDEEEGLVTPAGAGTGGEPLFASLRSGSWEDWTEREIPAPPDDLPTHLRRQVALREGVESAVLRAFDYWLGCLDERGYAPVSALEVSSGAGVSLPAAEAALALLQSLDPAGVGATDLRDTLRLQLARLHPDAVLARRLVDEAWAELPRGLGRVAEVLACTQPEVAAALRILAHLSPCPGRAFDPEPVRAIWPDVVVREVDGIFHVSIEEASHPTVRWAPDPPGLASADAEARAFFAGKRRQARWLLRALTRRRQTLLAVTEAVVERQEEFFRRGPEALRPLTLKEIAGAVGLHESTVARVTQDKHVDTPRGLLPLRYFFSGRVRRVGEEDVAARAVQERVREIIRREVPGNPVSDQEIAARLTSEGIRIARRTVAKYRDQLGIPRAQLRGLAIPAA